MRGTSNIHNSSDYDWGSLKDDPEPKPLEYCGACSQEDYFNSPERTAEEMEAAQPPVLYHTCKKRKGTDR